MEEIFNLVGEMSPYLLLGFFLAGVMHAFIPAGVYNHYLSGKGFVSVLYGALFGVPLPLCSCGVLPTAMSLRREGASKGATTAFLISTPETGIDSIIATYSLLGLPFALLRPIAALCNAVLGGWLVDKFDRDEHTCVEHDACTCHSHAGCNDCTCDDDDDDDECCESGCCCCHDKAKPTTFTGKMKEALAFGFVEMMQDIGKWLAIGLVVAGLITLFVPDDFFAMFRGNTQLSMLLVLCIAIPMYICATGSIPIAVALMMKGLTPGAALVLLMAGPACNMASILVIRKVMGRRTLVLYLVSIIAMAILWGHVVDYLLPSEWFQMGLFDATCAHEGFTWMNTACSILLGILLVNAMYRSKHHHEAHCDDEHHEHHHEHNQ